MTPLEILYQKKKQARKNANRIRNKLLDGKTTRVSHTFWEQVEQDYINQIKQHLNGQKSSTK